MKSSIEDELREIYVKALRLHCRPEDLPRCSLIAALDIDSISALEILVSVETAYSIEFSAESLSAKTLDSFETLAGCIAATRSADSTSLEQ